MFNNPPRVLLLQGPSSDFFNLVGDALRARDVFVMRVCFCPGDRLFWRGKPWVLDRSRLEDWPTALERQVRAHEITDLLMLGDLRPRHRAAIAAAHGLGLRAHVVELGYVRPNWLTHEIGGMGPNSALDFGAPWESSAHAPPDAAAPNWRKSFAAEAAMDVAYHLSNLLIGPFWTPGYRSHSSVHPLAEYAGWARKLAGDALFGARRARRADAAIAAWAGDPRPLFVLPLQLAADAQVRVNGTAAPYPEAVAAILRSFAAYAPADARLVLKPHPLDNTLIDWPRLAARAAPSAAARLFVTGGGDLDALIRAAAGVVTVNSGAGLRALALGAPTIALGRALYDRPGLAHQGALDEFWTAPRPPDPEIAARFLARLKAATQFRGAFDGEGARAGAATLAARILAAAQGAK